MWKIEDVEGEELPLSSDGRGGGRFEDRKKGGMPVELHVSRLVPALDKVAGVDKVLYRLLQALEA